MLFHKYRIKQKIKFLMAIGSIDIRKKIVLVIVFFSTIKLKMHLENV